MTRKLPRGWEWVPLGRLAPVIRNGVFVSRPSQSPPGHRILRISAVRPGVLDVSDVRFASDLPEGYERFFVSPGHLLVTRYSGNPAYVGSAAVVPELPEPTLHPDKLIRVELDQRLADPRFVAFALNTASRPDIESRLKTTAGQVGIAGSQLREVSVPVAPLHEQRRIVAAVEEVFSRLDAAVRLLGAGRQRLPFIRRAVLQHVLPDPLPAHWKLLTVEKAGHVDLGRQRSPQYHTGTNMRPYLRVANVHEDRIDLSDVKEMHFPPEQLPRYELKPGDILLNEGQSPEFVGRPAMYRGDLPGACFTNSLIRFRPFDFVDGEYVLLVFLRHLRFGRFQREAQITTNIAHMAAGRFKRVEFPVPPLDEQREIVQDVRRQLSLLDAFDAELRTALRRAESLRRGILAAAFRGKLAPQDPADEPASELLARIAAERPAPTARGRKKKGA
jgi:type I restriction enzyme S subunit